MSEYQDEKEETLETLRAERDALRQELERARRDAVMAEAVENCSEAVVVYDLHGHLLACNSNFRRLYGYTKEEARPGVHFAELGRIDVERGNVVVGDEYGGGEAYLARKAEYRRKLTGSFIVRMKDGRWIKTTDRPMTDGGFVSVQSDITEIKDNENALLVAKEAAERADRIKSEFLANVSHDLRTPLNAIIGFSEIMKEQLFGPLREERYEQYVASIHDSGRLLLSIVGDLLDTSKLDRGQFELRMAPFDIVAVVSQLLQNFDVLELPEGANVGLAVPPDFDPVIIGDERVIRQIVNNLVSNACRFIAPGGSIQVSLARQTDHRMRLEVRDDGEGMSPDLVERVGEPFLQEDAYVAGDRSAGTGLGLYICSRYAMAMGGELRIASAPGEGTVIAIDWPLPQQRPDSADGAGHPLH